MDSMVSCDSRTFLGNWNWCLFGSSYFKVIIAYFCQHFGRNFKNLQNNISEQSFNCLGKLDFSNKVELKLGLLNLIQSGLGNSYFSSFL